tara:strand:+ start:1115 stop:1246 length:132 start_codon:yes stop_codon:yes gene_type:complete
MVIELPEEGFSGGWEIGPFIMQFLLSGSVKGAYQGKKATFLDA